MAFDGSRTRVIRIIPDQQGRGGSKTSLSTQSINPDIRLAKNVFVYFGRWRRAAQAIQAAGYDPVASGITKSYALHNYARFDTSNANTPAENRLLSHNSYAGGTTHRIYDQTGTAAIVKSLTTSNNDVTPAVFLNIKNRCFMCWSATANFIYDGTHTYDVGVDAPATAATYTLGGSNTGVAAVMAGGSRVTWITGTAPFSNAVTVIFIGGQNYNTLQPTPFFNGPFANPGVANGTAGSTTVTITGGLWPVRDYVGLFLNIPSTELAPHYILSYTLSGADTTVTIDTPLDGSPSSAAYTVSGEQLILASPYLGASNVAENYTAFSDPLVWGSVPPQYSYAYYDDPATNTVNGYGTGHISDESPVTFVTEQDQTSVSVDLRDIIPSRTEDQARFNKIQIFRTVLTGGGGIRFPLDPSVGLLDNTGASPLTFHDTFDDSYLLTASGLSAPGVSNRKPPPFTHMAYWNAVLWGNPVNDPSAIVFSGDIVSILYGVPEECFASRNALRIPSDDGRVTGMRLVGPLLIITTERYAYYVVGGPDAGSYRLVRFSTLTNGVGDYQMAEFSGQTTEDSDALLYLGKDKKMYLTAPTFGNIPLSDPVQDTFTNSIISNYSDTRVFSIAIEGKYFVVATLGPQTMAYDFERKLWTNHFIEQNNANIIPIQGYATVFGDTPPVKFLFISEGTIWDWLGPNGLVGNTQASVSTPPIPGQRKARQRLEYVRIYVSDPTNANVPWSVQATVDENITNSIAATKYLSPAYDPLLTIQPEGCSPIDDPNARELIAVFPTSGVVSVCEGYRHTIQVSWPQGSGLGIQDLYAIDICLTDLEEPQQVSL